MLAPRALGLALGYAADLVFADPRRGHPVAVFGTAAAALERRLWADSRAAGAAYTAVCVAVPTITTAVLARGARGRPVTATSFVAVCTWASLGGASLRAEGRAMTRLLAAASGDLGTARARLSHLCSRDASTLDARELARATVESLAENTSDAVVAPLVWGAVFGAPGVVAYRAANTLDAMVGYRTERHTRFGWASARLDDVLNLVPSRLTAALTVVAAPVVGGSGRTAWRAWRADAAAHPSPNAGPVEASAAGALGVRLGGANVYGARVENRGLLHADGRDVTVADIARTARLTRVVGAGALAVTMCLAGARTPSTHLRRRRG